MPELPAKPAESVVENVRLVQHKGLKTCELKRMGRINVLCGRNNSGKTTILEALSDPKKRFFGTVLTDALSEGIHGVAVQFDGLRSPPIFSSHVRARLTAMKREQPDRVWYSAELGALAKSLAEGWPPLKHPVHGMVPQALLPSFIAATPREDLPTVLVPAKRLLETETDVAKVAPQKPNGEGVARRLFFCRSQVTGSPDRSTYEKVAAAFKEVSAGWMFNIELSEQIRLTLRFSSDGKTWLPAESCGSGLQDLLVLLFVAIAPGPRLVLVEEPESHLHADLQRRLLSYLKGETEKQFVFATHSNVFLDGTLVDKVWHVTYDHEVKVSDRTSAALMLGDLGYSVADNLTSDLVILTEGPSDKPVLDEFLAKMGLSKRYVIKVWPLGGDIMDKSDLTVFKEGYRVVALIDNDPGSARVRKRFMTNCSELGIRYHQLQRYSIENYFTLEAMRKVLGRQIPDGVNKLQEDKKVADQIGIDPKRNAREIVRAMTLEDIKGADLMEFLELVAKECESSGR